MARYNEIARFFPVAQQPELPSDVSGDDVIDPIEAFEVPPSEPVLLAQQPQPQQQSQPAIARYPFNLAPFPRTLADGRQAPFDPLVPRAVVLGHITSTGRVRSYVGEESKDGFRPARLEVFAGDFNFIQLPNEWPLNEQPKVGEFLEVVLYDADGLRNTTWMHYITRKRYYKSKLGGWDVVRYIGESLAYHPGQGWRSGIQDDDTSLRRPDGTKNLGFGDFLKDYTCAVNRIDFTRAIGDERIQFTTDQYNGEEEVRFRMYQQSLPLNGLGQQEPIMFAAYIGGGSYTWQPNLRQNLKSYVGVDNFGLFINSTAFRCALLNPPAIPQRLERIVGDTEVYVIMLDGSGHRGGTLRWTIPNTDEAVRKGRRGELVGGERSPVTGTVDPKYLPSWDTRRQFIGYAEILDDRIASRARCVIVLYLPDGTRINLTDDINDVVGDPKNPDFGKPFIIDRIEGGGDTPEPIIIPPKLPPNNNRRYHVNNRVEGTAVRASYFNWDGVTQRYVIRYQDLATLAKTEEEQLGVELPNIMLGVYPQRPIDVTDRLRDIEVGDAIISVFYDIGKFRGGTMVFQVRDVQDFSFGGGYFQFLGVKGSAIMDLDTKSDDFVPPNTQAGFGTMTVEIVRLKPDGTLIPITDTTLPGPSGGGTSGTDTGGTGTDTGGGPPTPTPVVPVVTPGTFDFWYRLGDETADPNFLTLTADGGVRTNPISRLRMVTRFDYRLLVAGDVLTRSGLYQVRSATRNEDGEIEIEGERILS